MVPSTTPAQVTSSHRIVPLDGLRGIAIALVFVFHAFGVPGLWMGVDLFFVLSGFLITGILYGQKDRPFREYIGRFYSRRARRILPAYVVVLVLTGLLFGFGFFRYWYMFLGFMNFQGTLTKALPAGPSYLPLWSLAVEEQFYFIWPIVIFAISRRWLVRCAAVLVVLAPVLRFLCTPHLSGHSPIYQWLPFRMDDLAAGALLALVWPEIRTRVQYSRRFHRGVTMVGALTMVVGFGSLLLLHHAGITTISNTPIANAVLYSITALIMFAAVLLTLIGVGKRTLSSWPLVWLGKISFSLYLIHLTALQLAHHNPWVALDVSLAYSVIMWFVVEKPFLTPGASKRKVLVTHAEAVSS